MVLPPAPVISLNRTPGICALAVCLAGAILWSGCRRSTPESQAIAPREETPAVEPAPANNSESQPAPRNVKPIVDSDSADTAADLDELIRQAAGPLADQVNSSLARLNTNLGKKEHTLVIMAMKSETRRWYFLTHFMGIIDDQQFVRCSDIIDSYADEYQDLLERRARILENARDGQNTRQLLEFNKVAAIKLSIQVRKQMIRTVLSPEQRKQYAAQFAPPPDEKQKSQN